MIEQISQGAPDHFGLFLRTFLQLVRTRLASEPALNQQDLVVLMLQAEVESRHPSMPPEFRRNHVFPQLARIYDREFRHQALGWAAEWARSRNRSFKIFGRDWHAHPILGQFAAGEIDNGEPLRCLYRASSVNLQINGYASLHQRLLDGIASGGFVLSRYNPADFVRQPFAAIARMIREHRMMNLEDVMRWRAADDEFRAACDQAERLSGMCIAPLTTSTRTAQVSVLRQGNPVPALLTDDSLFNVLAESHLIPHRAALDIPGFERTTFRTKQQLHDLLDQYVDAPGDRDAITRMMRPAVLANDSYDGVVDQILRHFASLPETPCAGC